MDGRELKYKSVPILGAGVTPFRSYGQAVACAAEQIESGRKAFWVAVNPEKVYRSWRDRRVRDVLAAADVGICDGVGVSYAAKLLHGRFIPRCTGCDLFSALIAASAQRGWGVFLLGANPDSNRVASENLRARYPRLRIVGRQDGYFLDADAVVEKINASGADLLFVAMGSPAQEFWIADHIGSLNIHVALGVGGSFDVASGLARRAPRWVRRLGMEFFYRAVTTPGWTMKSRLQRTGVKFVFAAAVLRHWIRGGRRAVEPTA